jgi:hypothetical protein
MEKQLPLYTIAIVAPVHVNLSPEWIQSMLAVTKGKDNVRVIIVDDSDGKVELPSEWDVYGYDRQREELGDEMYALFERFHKSSSCRNFGHWIAWRDGADIIIGLDSDCVVPPDFISQHMYNLLKKSHGWTNPLEGTGWFSRGYPYHQRHLKTILSLGLWNAELDLYGKDRVDNPDKNTSDLPKPFESRVADGFVPLSGMNWACWADAVPGLLFLPNFDYMHGEKQIKFRRHDDIWGGYIFQKMMELRNERIIYGYPVVQHQTVVNADKDAEEEEGMVMFEKLFLESVDMLFSADIEWQGNYEDLMAVAAAKAMEAWEKTEWEPVAIAMWFWSRLCGSTQRRI